jgi:hypothetical protein
VTSVSPARTGYPSPRRAAGSPAPQALMRGPNVFERCHDHLNADVQVLGRRELVNVDAAERWNHLAAMWGPLADGPGAGLALLTTTTSEVHSPNCVRSA